MRNLRKTFLYSRSRLRLPSAEEVSDLKNLRARLFILSVSLVVTLGPFVFMMGRLKGFHDGDE